MSSPARLLPLLLLCLSCLCLPAAALLPTVCVGNVTKEASVCCPVPAGFSAPCGGKGRGQCLRVQSYREYNRFHPSVEMDDRMQWPSRFFKFACQCDAKFWGADCGECFFGWRGPNCRERDVRLRRNIFTLSPKRRRQYLEITKLMRVKISPYSVLIEQHPNTSDPLRNPKFVEATVHYWLVFVHKYASRRTIFDNAEQCNMFGKLDMNHGGPGFVTWHRYYTMMLEREMHKLAVEQFQWTDFALPYWDWVDATWCEVCNNELVGDPGACDQNGQRIHSQSPFLQWDEFCGGPRNSSSGLCVGCHARSEFGKLVRQWRNLKMPTTAEVEFALGLPEYYIPGEFKRSPFELANCSFSRMLEGHCGPREFYGSSGTLHNKVHDSVHGSFCCSSTAPNDPIFFLHHSQVSRIVHMWFLRHQPSVMQMANIDTMPGHARQNFMVGFFPAIRHEEVFTSIRSLGYEYDTLEFGEPVRRRLEERGLLPKPTLQHFMTCQRGFLHPQYRQHVRHFSRQLEQFLASESKRRAEL